MGLPLPSGRMEAAPPALQAAARADGGTPFTVD